MSPGNREPGEFPRGLWALGGVVGWGVICRAQSHTFTQLFTHYRQFKDACQPTIHAFGLGEETGGKPWSTERTCKLCAHKAKKGIHESITNWQNTLVHIWIIFMRVLKGSVELYYSTVKMNHWLQNIWEMLIPPTMFQVVQHPWINMWKLLMGMWAHKHKCNTISPNSADHSGRFVMPSNSDVRGCNLIHVNDLSGNFSPLLQLWESPLSNLWMDKLKQTHVSEGQDILVSSSLKYFLPTYSTTL